MKDPLGIMGNDTIFVLENYNGNNIVEEFENIDKFKAGVRRKTYTLPYNWDGTGAVVYGSYVYYNRYWITFCFFWSHLVPKSMGIREKCVYPVTRAFRVHFLIYKREKNCRQSHLACNVIDLYYLNKG